MLGQGRIDFKRVRQSLDKIHYSGWIQIEAASPHGVVEDYRTDLHSSGGCFPAGWLNLEKRTDISVGLIELAIMAVMVVFNGVFAGYEIALASVTVARLQVLVGENRAGAKAALYMKQNIEASLAAIQIAVTLLAAIAAAIGGAGAAENLTPCFQFGLHYRIRWPASWPSPRSSCR